MNVELSEDQLDAIEHLKNGVILRGDVGSGKSRTAVGYYLFKVCEGSVRVNGTGDIRVMKNPMDLIIITTAKKRDTLEWEGECARFMIFPDRKNSLSRVSLTVDSWNNIKKYKDIHNAFFIFDEQRLVGSGVWVKTFLNIVKTNKWILLTATPGDSWSDYIPVFIANGFYRNKTEFNSMHCVYSRFSKYPKIERYVDVRTLLRHQKDILVSLEDRRTTVRHIEIKSAEFDRDLFKKVYIARWDPYDECPIEEAGKWVYLMRKVVNSDPSRIEILKQIYLERKRVIVFYNFTYELNILREFCDSEDIPYSEWNGEKHQELLKGTNWLYLVQYSAGCEGWNCISTNTIVFYSLNYSYKNTEQASGRIDRMNTPYIDLYYYYIKSASFIDVMVYRKLKDKKDFNERSLKF